MEQMGQSGKFVLQQISTKLYFILFLSFIIFSNLVTTVDANWDENDNLISFFLIV